MAISTIDIGSNPNDSTGDDLRTAGGTINSNFSELDDRTAGFGSHASAPANASYADADGNIGYGTTFPAGRVEITNRGAETSMLNVDINDFDGSNSVQYGILVDADTPDFAPNQNTSHFGARYLMTATSVVTPTDSSGDRHYIYGTRSDVDAGSAYLSYGAYNYCEVEGGDVSQSGIMYGTYSIGKCSSSDLTGGAPAIYGGSFAAVAAHTAGTTLSRGLRGEVQQDGAGGTLSTAYAVYADVDHNAGTMSVAAQFYGYTTGTPGTSWGVYSAGAKAHYFEASAESGDAYRIKGSGASFTGDLLHVESAVAAGTGFDLIVASANSGADEVFRVRGDGQVTADGSFTGGGADYAELYEWEDGNPDAEDRVGLSVVSAGNRKIRVATADDDSALIIGVTSADPVVLGDAAPLAWSGKFLKDDFGRPLHEAYHVFEWVDEVEETVTETETRHETQEVVRRNKAGETIIGSLGKPLTKTVKVPVDYHKDVIRRRKVNRSYVFDKLPDGVTVPASAVKRTTAADGKPFMRAKLNPDYDPARRYTPRQDRPEYEAIGSHGKLRLRAGQRVGDRWIKHADIAPGIEEWIVR